MKYFDIVADFTTKDEAMYYSVDDAGRYIYFKSKSSDRINPFTLTILRLDGQLGDTLSDINVEYPAFVDYKYIKEMLRYGVECEGGAYSIEFLFKYTYYIVLGTCKKPCRISEPFSSYCNFIEHCPCYNGKIGDCSNSCKYPEDTDLLADIFYWQYRCPDIDAVVLVHEPVKYDLENPCVFKEINYDWVHCLLKVSSEKVEVIYSKSKIKKIYEEYYNKYPCDYCLWDLREGYDNFISSLNSYYIRRDLNHSLRYAYYYNDNDKNGEKIIVYPDEITSIDVLLKEANSLRENVVWCKDSIKLERGVLDSGEEVLFVIEEKEGINND